MKIKLIVPNQSSDGQPCNPIDEYGQRIAAIAGGFTAYQAVGGWVDNRLTLIVESVTVFEMYNPALSANPMYSWLADQFKTLAGQITQDLAQQCVYLEIDGVVDFINPSPEI
jgi:hypothetical protein